MFSMRIRRTNAAGPKVYRVRMRQDEGAEKALTAPEQGLIFCRVAVGKAPSSRCIVYF